MEIGHHDELSVGGETGHFFGPDTEALQGVVDAKV